MLSARGEEVDRILGLEIGADDYLTKPFAMRELVARIKAQLRRVSLESARQAIPDSEPHVLIFGDVLIDPAGRRVTVSGRELAFKPKEFDLLLYLARHRDIVISRAQLLRDVWDYDVPIDTRTVDVHVRGVRQKLASVTLNGPDIETSRGSGYRLAYSGPGSSTGDT
jgi:two-component system response regulator ResD